MFNFLTKKAYLLFYLAIVGTLIFSGTNAEPPLRDISLNLQPPSLQNQIVKLVQPDGVPQLAAQSTYYVDVQNQNVQLEVPDNTYLLANTYGAPDQSYHVPNKKNAYGVPEQSYGVQDKKNAYGVPEQSYGVQDKKNAYGVPEQSYGVQDKKNAYGIPDQSYRVQDKKFPNYKSNPKPFRLTVKNVTTDLRGNLDLPFGQRIALSLTYPPMEESSFAKQSSAGYGYGGYGPGDYDNNENEVKFSGESEINFGNIVSDTFVLKERIRKISSSNSNPRPSVSPSSTPNDRASILNGILNTVIENGPNAINISTSNQTTPQQREREDLHLPGDLIAKEIPLNGEMNFGGLDNLTEFLIDDASKSRSNGRQFQSGTEQAPMFVAVQFNTVGRNKFKTDDEGGQKNSKIHVVLGHKHFSFRNIKNLNELYDYVNEDYETYQPPSNHGFNQFSVQPKFRISKVVIDLIIEFVHFSWKVHQDTDTSTEARGKDITKKIAKILRQNVKNRPKFRPNKSEDDFPLDFFTWAYTNTLGYRTLV